MFEKLLAQWDTRPVLLSEGSLGRLASGVPLAPAVELLQGAQVAQELKLSRKHQHVPTWSGERRERDLNLLSYANSFQIINSAWLIMLRVRQRALPLSGMATARDWAALLASVYPAPSAGGQ